MGDINEYSRHQIQRFYKSFLERSFDQDDVAQFFVNSRDYSKEGSIIRDVGDFLAHPKLKDRGIVLKSIKEIMPLFDNMIESEKKGLVDYWNIPTFKGLGSDEVLIDDLNYVFNVFGLNEIKIVRKDNSYRDFLFCTIFLLSTFKIKFENKNLDFEAIYSHSLSLQAKCESSSHKRHFSTLPVLQLQNIWINCVTTPRAPEHKLQNYIARRFKQGFIAAISYENDIKFQDKIYDANDFEKGEVWPSPDRTC